MEIGSRACVKSVSVPIPPEAIGQVLGHRQGDDGMEMLVQFPDGTTAWHNRAALFDPTEVPTADLSDDAQIELALADPPKLFDPATEKLIDMTDAEVTEMFMERAKVNAATIAEIDLFEGASKIAPGEPVEE